MIQRDAMAPARAGWQILDSKENFAMATDPVQSVQSRQHETAIDRDVRRPIRRIAAFPPSPDVPYVTVRLDWRPDGTKPGSRSARDIVVRKLDEIVSAQEQHTPAGEALLEARDAIETFLDTEVDPSVHGVYIVAGGVDRVFVPLTLGMSIATAVDLGPIPVLMPLVRFVEDNPPFAVLVADQRDATLTIVDQTRVTSDLVVESSEYPRHQQQGGWSQRRYQARADERISAFARGVAEETQRALDEADIDLLIVAGDEVIMPELDANWHHRVKERIAGYIRVNSRASQAEAVEKANPVAEQAARKREADAVNLLANNAGGPLAVGGVEQTLTALEEGRVMHLVLSEDFRAEGWADYTFPVAGAGAPPNEHPAGGDPAAIMPIALEEEMIRLALAQDASIEIVHSLVPIEEVADGSVPQAGGEPPITEAAKQIDELGGVGAMLRYAVIESEPGIAATQ